MITILDMLIIALGGLGLLVGASAICIILEESWRIFKGWNE